MTMGAVFVLGKLMDVDDCIAVVEPLMVKGLVLPLPVHPDDRR